MEPQNNNWDQLLFHCKEDVLYWGIYSGRGCPLLGDLQWKRMSSIGGSTVEEDVLYWGIYSGTSL